jgi:hypothetical protein
MKVETVVRTDSKSSFFESINDYENYPVYSPIMIYLRSSDEEERRGEKTNFTISKYI